MIKDPKFFWESEEFELPYQHGPHPHRLYILNLLKNKEVKTLLDVGCGTGPLYILNKDFGLDYKGVDYSRTMIETAKREFPEGDFEVQDMRHLKEKDNSWDCVVLMHALDHVDDYKAAIKEAARVAKSYVCIILWRKFAVEGTFIREDWSYSTPKGQEKWEQPHYLQEYSMDALFTAFREAGLKVEEMEVGGALNGSYSRYNSLFLCKLM